MAGGLSFFFPALGLGGVFNARRIASSRRRATSASTSPPSTVSSWMWTMAEPPKPALPLGEQIRKVLSGIKELQDQSGAATAMTALALMDLTLQRALQAKMRPLNSKMRVRLFENYGPLSPVAAKIDLAFALNIVSQEMYNDLTIMNKIRVKFAHSAEFKKFSDPDVLVFFERLSDYQPGQRNLGLVYIDVLKRIHDHIVVTAGIDPVDSADLSNVAKPEA